MSHIRPLIPCNLTHLTRRDEIEDESCGMIRNGQVRHMARHFVRYTLYACQSAMDKFWLSTRIEWPFVFSDWFAYITRHLLFTFYISLLVLNSIGIFRCLGRTSCQVTQNYASETHVSSVRRFLSERRDQVSHAALCASSRLSWQGYQAKSWNMDIRWYLTIFDDIWRYLMILDDIGWN
jgi:hypothetical protein